MTSKQSIAEPKPRRLVTSTTTQLHLSFQQDEEERPEYSRETRLREEAESPFRKVRFFAYITLALGALTSLLVSTARIAAGLSGINVDLLQESTINAGVDVAGLVLIGILFQRDVAAQDSRLKRAQKGAALAKLQIQGSDSLLGGTDTASEDTSGKRVTATLAALRRGRGIEKRVVIATAGSDKIQSILQEATDLNDSLVWNDFVIIPVVYPQGGAPSLENLPECVALPVGNDWRRLIEDETKEARKQGVNVESEGISLVLKKNGRVGQRTRGVFLGNMVGEVSARRESGMDVSNI